MSYDYPEIGEAFAIDDILIQEFGGSMGIRDECALVSALMRPQLGTSILCPVIGSSSKAAAIVAYRQSR